MIFYEAIAAAKNKEVPILAKSIHERGKIVKRAMAVSA